MTSYEQRLAAKSQLEFRRENRPQDFHGELTPGELRVRDECIQVFRQSDLGIRGCEKAAKRAVLYLLMEVAGELPQ